MLIPRPAVRKRYGLSETSLWRWERNPSLNFPKPALEVGNRRFYDADDLARWEASRDRRKAEAVSA